jgi:uncharacterized protein YmfQ (DUF2313 family)
MSGTFLRVFQHLLPKAKAWQLTTNKQLRQFFDGLTGPLGDDVKGFADSVFDDIDPQKTRELDAWDAQFGLNGTDLTEQERRDRLEATWQALGGQDPRYIEDTLRGAGFDVYLHEWWSDTVPTARNPLSVLNDGLNPIQYIANCGAQKANCGYSEAVCGATVQPTGYPLVNKIQEALTTAICGAAAMSCGNAEAVCGARAAVYASKQYIVPSDVDKWPYFLYIGGQTYPDHATVPITRKNEFETLCLKICPTQQWLGMLIDYV